MKTNKKIIIITAILAFLVTAIIINAGFRFWRMYLNSDFTEKEYDEIIGRGKTEANGLLPYKNEFIRNDLEFNKKLSMVPKKRNEFVKKMIIKISKSEQQKLENPDDREILEKDKMIIRKFVACLSIEELDIYEYYRGLTNDFLRHLAILKADKYHAFKLTSPIEMSNKECEDFANEK